MQRRRFLYLLPAGIAVGLAGCGGVEPTPDDDWPPATPDDAEPAEPAVPTETPDPEEIPGADEYGTVVDLVAEGADDGGESSIVPLLEEHLGDDTLLFLDEGVYRMDETLVVDGVSELGIVGRDATIRPPAGWEHTLFSVRADRGLRVQGLTFDFDDAVGGRALQLSVGDDLEVVDVTIAGRFEAGPGPVRLDVPEADGAGVVEGLEIPDGGTFESDATGLYVGNRSHGDLTFRDCSIQGFPDNGLYADPPGGSMEVEGGYYANNGISNVRVKGGSTVRGVHVRCDGDHDDEFRNMRGIRANDFRARADADPVVVTGCRIELLDVTYSDGAIELTSRLAELVVEDTLVVVDADEVEGILAKSPDDELRDGEATPRIHCANVTVTGSAARRSAIRVDDRDGCTLEGLNVRQRGLERNGVEFRRSSGNTITDSFFDVTGDPVVLTDATADVDGIVSTHAPPFPFDRTAARSS